MLIRYRIRRPDGSMVERSTVGTIVASGDHIVIHPDGAKFTVEADELVTVPAITYSPSPAWVLENRRISAEMLGPSGEHDHSWGPVEHAFFTGNPHRKCTVEGCRHITLDLSDDEDEDE